jgi:DNA-binding CsgD family transcriptional regulator
MLDFVEGRRIDVPNALDTVSHSAAAHAMSDDVFRLVSRRRPAQMYVFAQTGEVAFSPADCPEPDSNIVGIATSLIKRGPPARHGAMALTDDGRVLRVVTLAGDAEPHFAVFVEELATRSPLEDAVERYSLSAREREVLRELLRGTSTADIALRLIIAPATVATHVRNIGAKMKASKRKEIVAAVLGHR